ncbi:hypothetical protein OWR29_08845 [Actinoplanes sp. Pm04-4]|uniref:Transcriptional regulator n=1 Tax=Paractinoplanes pyxinae TaxID=2997416 RepID=A0ABT4AW56_9ACTN|nr:hypothetical protein [Actinoplanes pyxinae]MCY1138102.1 hypothetical protein [Actinoplanes pyxinae]
MTGTVNWRDVKAKAQALDPERDSNERVARRRQMREQMLAASEARLGGGDGPRRDQA